MIAAILSITVFLFFRLTSASISTRSAAIVVNRSSHNVTGKPNVSFKKFSIIFRCFASWSNCIVHVFRDIRRQIRSLRILSRVRWILSMPNWPAPSSILTVSMPWAVHPSASLIAMPTVLDPTSNPIVLNLFSLRFHGCKTSQVLLGSRPVPTFGSDYVHLHDEVYKLDRPKEDNLQSG